MLVFSPYTPSFLSLKISRSVARTNAWPSANAFLLTAAVLDLSVYQGKKKPNIHNRIAESLLSFPRLPPMDITAKNEFIVFFLFLL